MTAQQIIESLAHLLKEQQALHKLAEEKTVLLKKGEIKALDQLLKEEEKCVKALQQAEEMRQKAVDQFLKKKGLVVEDVALTALIKLVSKDEGELLQELQEKLIAEITELKKRNELNRQLTKQSLQFVNASIAMLTPESSSITYQRPENRKVEEENRQSIFDSRA